MRLHLKVPEWLNFVVAPTDPSGFTRKKSSLEKCIHKSFRRTWSSMCIWEDRHLFFMSLLYVFIVFIRINQFTSSSSHTILLSAHTHKRNKSQIIHKQSKLNQQANGVEHSHIPECLELRYRSCQDFGLNIKRQWKIRRDSAVMLVKCPFFPPQRGLSMLNALFCCLQIFFSRFPPSSSRHLDFCHSSPRPNLDEQ